MYICKYSTCLFSQPNGWNYPAGLTSECIFDTETKKIALIYTPSSFGEVLFDFQI